MRREVEEIETKGQTCSGEDKVWDKKADQARGEEGWNMHREVESERARKDKEKSSLVTSSEYLSMPLLSGTSSKSI